MVVERMRSILVLGWICLAAGRSKKSKRRSKHRRLPVGYPVKPPSQEPAVQVTPAPVEECSDYYDYYYGKGGKGKKGSGSSSSKKSKRRCPDKNEPPTLPPVPPPTPAPALTPQPAPIRCSDPNATRSELLLEALSLITPVSQLEDTTTPQGMAYLWLLDEDSATDPCLYPSLEQRYALATHFYATDGIGSWTNSSGWLSPDQECEWELVECDFASVSTLGLRTYRTARMEGLFSIPHSSRQVKMV